MELAAVNAEVAAARAVQVCALGSVCTSLALRVLLPCTSDLHLHLLLVHAHVHLACTLCEHLASRSQVRKDLE